MVTMIMRIAMIVMEDDDTEEPQTYTVDDRKAALQPRY